LSGKALVGKISVVNILGKNIRGYSSHTIAMNLHTSSR